MAHLAAYVGVVAVIVVLPGPDMALVLQNGVVRGRRAALVFTTLIPQFIGDGSPVFAQTLVLSGVFIAMGLVWLTGYALLVAKAGALLGRPNVRRAVSAITGAVLVALGVRVALERRG